MLLFVNNIVSTRGALYYYNNMFVYRIFLNCMADTRQRNRRRDVDLLVMGGVRKIQTDFAVNTRRVTFRPGMNKMNIIILFVRRFYILIRMVYWFYGDV